MEKLLKQKGFTLNTYPEGMFWELTNDKSDDSTVKMAELFGFNGDIEEGVERIDLQCNESFEECVMCIDGDVWQMDSEEFMKCVNTIK